MTTLLLKNWYIHRNNLCGDIDYSVSRHYSFVQIPVAAIRVIASESTINGKIDLDEMMLQVPINGRRYRIQLSNADRYFASKLNTFIEQLASLPIVRH